MKTALIIGAGIGGLATAIRLQTKGWTVTVLEANSYPGGKLTQTGNANYRFDAGPSLFTMPEKVDELLNLKGRNGLRFSYKKLSEVCRYFYEDGTVIKGWGERERFADEVSQKLGVPRELVRDHLKHSEFTFDATAHLFLEKSLHKISSYLNPKTLSALAKLPFLNLNRTMNEVNEKALKHDKLVQLFNRYATYNGSDPYKAPGILNIIPHLEFGRGAFFPEGGMHSICFSLFEKAIDLGVEFKFNTRASSVQVANRSAKSVIDSAGVSHTADIVVSNMDVVPFYRKLLPNERQPKKVLTQERSSSALIFYWGIQKTFPDLILHNIFFSGDYREEFRQILDEHSISEDPTVYINISSKHNPSDAPEGCENWFVMINVPADTGQNWKQLIMQSRKNILKKLSRILMEDISALIQYESILDPLLIEQKTGSYQGSLYGSASNNKMAAFFRHPNFSSNLKNLYFCGGSVHPGGGIPLALSSAKIVSELAG